MVHNFDDFDNECCELQVAATPGLKIFKMFVLSTFSWSNFLKLQSDSSVNVELSLCTMCYSFNWSLTDRFCLTEIDFKWKF